jgi:uncharacterized RDD family membrane protein YckC
MQPPPPASPARKQAPRCAVHVEALATTICTRCGSYACMECHRLGHDGQDYCQRCVSKASEPASRGSRFVANLVDSLVLIAPLLGGMLLGALVGGDEGMDVAMVGMGMLGMLVLVIYQTYLAVQSGQTIGKRMMGIRVVRTDGTPVDGVRIIVLRNVVPFAINAGCGLFNLIDALFIFKADRRCLHDHIADTQVVTVGGQREGA